MKTHNRKGESKHRFGGMRQFLAAQSEQQKS